MIRHAVHPLGVMHGVLWYVLFSIALGVPVRAQTPDTMHIAGHVGGWTGTAVIDGDLAWVNHAGVLVSLDLTTPTPTQRGFLTFPGGERLTALTRAGAHAFVALRPDSLCLVDIVDPTHPTLRSVLAIPGLTRSAQISDLAVGNQYAYLCAGDEGVHVVDVSAPQLPVHRRSLALTAWRIAVTSTHAFLLTDSAPMRLTIMDLANPAQPVVMGSIPLPSAGRRLAVRGVTVYVTTAQGLLVIDVSNPAAPVQRAVREGTRSLNCLAVQDTRLYAEDNTHPDAEQTRLLVFDLTDPWALNLVGALDGVTRMNSLGANATQVYAADGHGLQRIDATNPSAMTRTRDPNPSDILGIAARDSLLVMTDQDGVFVYNAQPLDAPRLLGRNFLLPNRRKPVIIGPLLYTLSLDENRFSVIDLADPRNPVERGSYVSPVGKPQEMAARGTLAFLGSLFGKKLEILDLSLPAQPVRLAELSLPGDPKDISVADTGHFVYVATNSGTNGHRVCAIDISQPTAPVIRLNYPLQHPPAAVLAVRDRLYIADNRATGQFDIMVLDITNGSSPLPIVATTVPGSVWALAVRDSLLLASHPNGGVTAFHLFGNARPTMPRRPRTAMGQIQTLSQLFVPQANDILIGPTVGTDVAIYVQSGYATDLMEKYGTGSGGLYVVRRNPPTTPRRKLTMNIAPVAAVADGCGTTPAPGTAEYAVNEVVGLTALPATDKGWNFVRWTGDASGTSVTTSVTMDRDKQAIANFIQPELRLTVHPRVDALCPACTTCDGIVQSLKDTIVTFTLCADEDDDWVIGSLSLAGSGSGNERRDVERVELYLGTDLLDMGAFTQDDGTVSLTVQRTIPKDQCRTFTVVYTFTPQAQPDRWPATYFVGLGMPTITARPATYPFGVKIPAGQSTTSGPLTMGRVINERTREVFMTIADALLPARCEAGDLLTLCPGLYIENTRVHIPVTMQSEAGPKYTSLQASDSSSTALYTDAHLGLKGLVFRNSGRGVHATTLGTRLTLYNCWFENNGVGMEVTNAARIDLSYVRFEKQKGNGIWAERCSEVHLDHCTALRNDETGATLSDIGTNTVTDCVFQRNGVDGMRLAGVQAFFASDNRFESNAVTGLRLSRVSESNPLRTNVVVGCRFESNGVKGIHADAVHQTDFRECTFLGNGFSNPNDLISAAFESFEPDYSLSFEKCDFVGNASIGIHANAIVGLRITGCRFEGNQSDGISLGLGTENVDITRCTFRNLSTSAFPVILDGVLKAKITDNVSRENYNGMWLRNPLCAYLGGNTVEDAVGEDLVGGLQIGLLLQSGTDVLAKGNQVNRNAGGIAMDSVHRAFVLSNHVWSNRHFGIRYRGCRNGGIAENSVWFNGVNFMGKRAETGGILLRDAEGIVTQNSLSGNVDEGIAVSGGFEGRIIRNHISGNPHAGLRNVDGVVEIDARENWWGSADGPGGEGPGSGDAVWGRVRWENWRHTSDSILLAVAPHPLLATAGERDSVVLVTSLSGPWPDSLVVSIRDPRHWTVDRDTVIVIPDADGASLVIPVTPPQASIDGENTEIGIKVRRPGSTLPAGETLVRVIATVPHPARLRVLPVSAHLRRGDSLRCHATVLDQNGRGLDRPVTWSASSGTVSSEGWYRAATSPGVARVTASVAGSSVTADVVIHIEDSLPRPAKLVVVPSRRTMAPEDSLPVAAILVDPLGSERPASVRWVVTGGHMHAGFVLAAPGTTLLTIIAIEDQTALSDTVTVRVLDPRMRLISPADGEVGVTARPFLRWSDHPWARTYSIRIAEDSSFLGAVIEDSLVSGTEWRPTVRRGATWYWQVTAHDGARAVRSPVWRFSTRGALPGIVLLQRPVNGAIDQPLSLECQWIPDPAFDHYRFTLAEDSAMTQIVAQDTAATGDHVQVQGLHSQIRYFWTVTGISPFGELVKGPIWRFTTRDTSTVRVDSPVPPAEFFIESIAPHPVRERTVVWYRLREVRDVTIVVRTLLGTELARLENLRQGTGRHGVEWVPDPALPSGTYLIEMQAGDTSARLVRSVVVIR